MRAFYFFASLVSFVANVRVKFSLLFYIYLLHIFIYLIDYYIYLYTYLLYTVSFIS